MFDLPKDLWSFMRERKKFWLTPVIAVLLLVGLLVLSAEFSAVAPFIYTLFEQKESKLDGEGSASRPGQASVFSVTRTRVLENLEQDAIALLLGYADNSVVLELSRAKIPAGKPWTKRCSPALFRKPSLMTNLHGRI